MRQDGFTCSEQFATSSTKPSLCYRGKAAATLSLPSHASAHWWASLARGSSVDMSAAFQCMAQCRASRSVRTVLLTRSPPTRQQTLLFESFHALVANLCRDVERFLDMCYVDAATRHDMRTKAEARCDVPRSLHNSTT